MIKMNIEFNIYELYGGVKTLIAYREYFLCLWIKLLL